MKLETAVRKLLPEYYDASHYLYILFKHPENEWFEPTNAQDEYYSICDQLARLNIICTQKIPI